AHMSRENAAAVMGMRERQWVLSTVNTALIGLDSAYALYEMAIDSDVFVERVRGVWSQFLVGVLCKECATPARLSPAERDYLFPTEPLMQDLKLELGCPACEGRGTKDRTAVCEALLIGDATQA